MTWLLTHSGVEFNLLTPTVDMINIEDIAHSLARTQRFNGHTNVNCNVALHSVMVAYLVKEHDRALMLPALLHDAAEAYTGDISTPVKQMLGHSVVSLQQRIDRVIAEKFGFKNGLGDAWIKIADLQCLKFERGFLPASRDWGCFDNIPDWRPPLWLWKHYDMDWKASRDLFLRTFKECQR